MEYTAPEWFRLTEVLTPQTFSRIGDAVENCQLSMQTKYSPLLAYWFMCDSFYLACEVNQKGMHANALALTRQSIEALGVVELGICKKEGAEETLAKWNGDNLKPGNLRAWLQNNVWQTYGPGLWNEPWSDFMREFAKAIQPYAHYCRDLAQWQQRLKNVTNEDDGSITAQIEIGPRAYDPQKATRISLFHAILTFALGRIWIAANPQDTEFSALIFRLGEALGKSEYLDGHSTDWGQQFWAMLWASDGKPLLE